MKKFISIIFVCLLIFAACSETTPHIPQIQLPIKITARIKGNESNFHATINQDDCEITFDHKHSLTGTILHFDKNGGTATIGDFTRNVDISVFPAQNAFVTAFRNISAYPQTAMLCDEGVKYTIDEMTILVYYNQDTKEIIGITTEERGRRFDFTIVQLESL